MASSITCPTCGSRDSDVSDSRPAGDWIRRRRICANGHRYTTREVVEGEPLDLPIGLTEQIGRRFIKDGGDYSFEGECIMVGLKRSGAVRYVLEDDLGLLFIFNERAIRPVEAAHG